MTTQLTKWLRSRRDTRHHHRLQRFWSCSEKRPVIIDTKIASAWRKTVAKNELLLSNIWFKVSVTAGTGQCNRHNGSCCCSPSHQSTTLPATSRWRDGSKDAEQRTARFSDSDDRWVSSRDGLRSSSAKPRRSQPLNSVTLRRPFSYDTATLIRWNKPFTECTEISEI